MTVDILKFVDEMYGNTDQDVSTWAVEYQLLTRMLIHHGYLLINPKHLKLSEVMWNICSKLYTPENKGIFRAAQALSEEELWLAYKATKPTEL